MKPCEPAAAREAASEDTVEWPAAVQARTPHNSSRSFDDIRRSLGAFEWVTFAYLAWLNSMLALFHRNVAHAAQYFVVHCWIALGIICLTWAAAHSRNRCYVSRAIGTRCLSTYFSSRSFRGWCTRFSRAGLTAG